MNQDCPVGRDIRQDVRWEKGWKSVGEDTEENLKAAEGMEELAT